VRLIELKRRNQCGGSVTGVDFCPGKKNLTGGFHLSVRGREREGVPLRVCARWAAAASGAGPDGFPGVQFYFYSPLLLFFFCFLYFFQTLLNFDQK
jgi:hypothetical protein